MIVLIDATSTSLTVSWPESSSGDGKYRLEYRHGSEGNYEVLSEGLSAPQARKRNLSDPDSKGFYFRAKSDQDSSDWMQHGEPFYLIDESKQLKAPTVTPASNQAVQVSWTTSADKVDVAYELQMRENKGGQAWETIAASLKGTHVKKKNLTSNNGYQFRVRVVVVVGKEDTNNPPFSPPSAVIVAPTLSAGMQRLFNRLENGTLLQNPGAKEVPLADALGGKEFVLLYASAHWCGPCRSFTPQLIKWYSAQKAAGIPIEVVFLSADHDEDGMEAYYKSMPWLAVPYEDYERENLMGMIKVTGIPRLVVLDGETGRILVDNAVGTPLDITQWRRLKQK